MIRELKLAFEAEMEAARGLIGTGDLDRTMAHLERAHVLGQYHMAPHVITHWWMLRVALKRRRLGDAIGQVLRIVLGAIGSAVGKVPHGNTGGSDVNMFKPMPIDPQLGELVERDRAASR